MIVALPGLFSYLFYTHIKYIYSAKKTYSELSVDDRKFSFFFFFSVIMLLVATTTTTNTTTIFIYDRKRPKLRFCNGTNRVYNDMQTHSVI